MYNVLRIAFPRLRCRSSFFGWRCISLLRSICIYPFTALMLMIKESKQANLKKRLLVQLNIWQQLVCVVLFGKKYQ